MAGVVGGEGVECGAGLPLRDERLHGFGADGGLSTQAATVSVLSRGRSSAKGALDVLRYSGVSDMAL